jgi:hypothetical protein
MELTCVSPWKRMDLDLPIRCAVVAMAKQTATTTEDRTETIRVALSGIASDLELGETAARLAPLHPKNNRAFRVFAGCARSADRYRSRTVRRAGLDRIGDAAPPTREPSICASRLGH